MSALNWTSLPVSRYVICDDDENVHQADNNRDFSEADALLHRLREADPTIDFRLYAEISA